MTDLECLNNMTGLTDLKEQIKAIQDDMELNKLRKTNGIKEVPQSYHMVFSGNPGTGKTTVARLVAGIFYELGILPTNGTVEVKSNDLISEYGTGTSEKTTSVLNDAIGKVLFIDEAYTLSDERDSKNGQEAIDTILKFMEDHQNEFVLIAAGYPDKMNTFLNSNPGLRSRFKRFINFKDYTPDELYSIFADWCTENDRIIEPDAIKKIKDHLTHLYNMRSGYFGNARAAKDYANAVMEAQSKRLNNSGIRNLSRSDLMTITAEDVALSEQPISLEDARRELDELIGIKGVKDKINEMITTVLADRIRTQQGGKPTQIPLHLVFTGNPGTGKTTVARKIAKIYNALGLLPSDHCCEVKRKDLIGPYLGQTEKRTVEWTEKASGGVLFIDEAYTLVNDEKDIYSTAAIDTLMAEMLRGDFAVIAAGYDKEMNEFLASNPGLKSRFKTIIHFDDYTPDEMMQIFEALCRTNNMRITNQAAKNLLYKFSHVNPGDPSFANARGVGNAFNDLLSIQSRRIVKNPTADALLFTEEDVSQYQPPGYF
jgi:SpoVK/Ycf46/Vps4 family AAA+-type ATPase